MKKPAKILRSASVAVLLSCAALTSHSGPEVYGEPANWQPNGDANNPDSEPTASEGSNSTTQQPASAVKRFKDLKVPPGFTFDGTRRVNLDINLDEPLSGPTQLTVCSRYQRVGQRYQIDYSSCPLSAPLTNGRYLGSLSVPDGTKSLIVHIIPVHDPASSRYVLWGLDAGEPKLMLR